MRVVRDRHGELVLGKIVGLALVAMWAGAAPSIAAEPAASADVPVGVAPASKPLAPAEIEDRYGVRFDGVRLASAGYMLDLRYWVVDSEKAWELFRKTSRRELVHAASGAHLIVPAPAYIGPLAQTTEKPKEGRRYFMFFANPGRLVTTGDLVSIRLDDVEIGPFAVD